MSRICGGSWISKNCSDFRGVVMVDKPMAATAVNVEVLTMAKIAVATVMAIKLSAIVAVAVEEAVEIDSGSNCINNNGCQHAISNGNSGSNSRGDYGADYGDDSRNGKIGAMTLVTVVW